MGREKFNAEGYYDPTAYDALTAIENAAKALRSFRPIVYICSPFPGEIDRQAEDARCFSRFAVAMGYIPLAPSLLFPQFLDDNDPNERELALFFRHVLMTKCAEVWVFGNHISSGMKAEIKRAKWKNIHLRYFSLACEEVAEGCK